MAKIIVNNWKSAQAALGRARNKQNGKHLKRNTFVVLSSDSPAGEEWDSAKAVYAIQYHYTEIIRYYPDGMVGESTGGWDTISTLANIRRYGVFTLSNDREMVWASRQGYEPSPLRGAVWPHGDWSYWKDRNIIFPDGTPVPALMKTRCPLDSQVLGYERKKRSRNPLHDPRVGDVFKGSGGELWIFVKLNTFNQNYGTGAKGFVRYFGDCPMREQAVVVDPDVAALEYGNTLFLLAQVGEEWKVWHRFTWERGGDDGTQPKMECD